MIVPSFVVPDDMLFSGLTADGPPYRLYLRSAAQPLYLHGTAFPALARVQEAVDSCAAYIREHGPRARTPVLDLDFDIQL